MAFKSWWNLLTQNESRKSSTRRKKPAFAGVRLESLEDRYAPAANLHFNVAAGNFSDPAAWLENQVPASGDTLHFDLGGSVATNDLPASSFILNFGSTGNSVTGSTIKLDLAGVDIIDTLGGNTISSSLQYSAAGGGSTINVSAGTLTIAGTGIVSGTGASPSLTAVGAGTVDITAKLTGTGAVLNAGTGVTAGSLKIENVANTLTGSFNIAANGTGAFAVSPSSSLGTAAVNLAGGTLNLITGIGGASATPGMYEGRLAGSFNQTDPLPVTVYGELTPQAGQNTGPWTPNSLVNADPATTTIGWGNDTTWLYIGQVYVAHTSDQVNPLLGTIAFAENIDDNVLMKFDGQTILNDTGWNNPTRGTVTGVSVGWHDFELRIGNGGGGAGPVNQNGWSGSYGFGYATPDTAGPSGWSTTSTNGQNFLPFTDPGTASLIRLPVTSAGASNSVSVTASSTINLDSGLGGGTFNLGGLTVGNGLNLAVNGSSNQTLNFTAASALGATTTFTGTGATLKVSGSITTPATATINQTGSGTTTLAGTISATTLTATASAGTLGITSLSNAFNASSTINAVTGGTVQVTASPGTSIGSAVVNLTGGNISLTTGTGASVVTAPGMAEGWLDGGFNVTAANPGTWTVNQPEAGYHNNGEVWGPGDVPNPRQATPVVDRQWHNDGYLSPGAANETWAYTGQFFLADSSDGVLDGKGTIAFAEGIDDNTLMKIDGRTMLADTAWNTPTANVFTGTAGWHDFEIRFGNGGGGAGPDDQGQGGNPNGFKAGYGFGYATPVTAGPDGWAPYGTNGANYLPFNDGTGTFIRYVTGVTGGSPFNNAINISGNVGFSTDSTINANTNLGGPVSIAAGSKVTFNQANTNGRAVFTGTTTLAGNVEMLSTSGAGLARPRFNGPVVGVGANLLKSGPGNVTLAGANTYSGTTTITGGTFFAANANALSGTTSITVTAGTLNLAATGINITVPVSIAGNGNGGIGAIDNSTGNSTISSNITLTDDATIGADAGLLTISGNINMGTNGLNFVGAGNITVTGNVTGTGSGFYTYAGFAGATGGLNVTETIKSWTYTSTAGNATLASPLSLNGSAQQASPGAPLVLTQSQNGQQGSAWTKVAVGVNFTSSFDFQWSGTSNPADAFAFALQANATSTLGGGGGDAGLGGVPNSLGVGYNIYAGNSLGTDPNAGNDLITFLNGGRTNQVDLYGATGGAINFHDGDPSHNYRSVLSYNVGAQTAAITIQDLDAGGPGIPGPVIPLGSLPNIVIPSFRANSIVKSGTGTVTLTGNNNYSGNTTVNNGILSVNSTGLGSTAKVIVNNGATLGLDSVTLGAGVPISAAGNGFNNIGAISSINGSVSTLSGLINSAGLSLGATAGSTLVVAGGLNTLGGDVTFAGAGSVNVTGPLNTHLNAALSGVTGQYFQIAPATTNQLVTTDPQWIGLATPIVTAPLTSALSFPNINGAGFVSASGTLYADSSNGLTGPNYDNVQARWFGTINIPIAGPVSFQTGSDDGSVIYVDGNLVVNNNFFQGTTYRSGTVNLSAGPHTIDIEFMQGGGGATMFALWDPTGGNSFIPLSPNALDGKVIKIGTGTATLSGASQYASLQINAGTIALANQSAVSGSSINVSSGGTFALNGTGITVAAPITAAGAGAGGAGAISNVSGTNVLSGAIGLTGDATISSAAGSLTINGNVSTASSSVNFFNGDPLQANLTFDGAGAITVNGRLLSAGTGTVTAGQLNANYYQNINPSNGGVPLDPNAAGFLGNYGPANIFSSPVLTSEINFANIDTNGYAPYTPAVGAVEFNTGALWYGKITIPNTAVGNQTWFTSSDDGSRLWIDGVLVVDNNFDQGVTERQGTTSLAPGSTHSILVGFYQGGGGAGMFANWDIGDGAGKVLIPATTFSTITGGGGVNTVIKNGTGSVSLAAATGSTYPGGTTVNNGTLFVNNTTGSATGPGGVLVTGGTLGGTGIISGTVTANAGTVSPGNGGAGTLTVGTNVVANSSGHYFVELASASPTVVNDVLAVTGNVNLNTDSNPLGGVSLDISAVNAAVKTGTTYTIVTAASVTGRFRNGNGGADLTDGTSFVSAGGVGLTIHYTATTVTLTVNAPTVTAVTPFSGPTAGGTTVIITGTNFGAVSGAAGVQFGLGSNATSYIVLSNSSIQAVTPAHAAGTVDVRVTNNSVVSAINAPADQYTFTATTAPTFSTFTVNGGDMFAIDAFGQSPTDLVGHNSVVEQLYVTFSIGVTLAPNAFRLDAGTVSVSIAGATAPVAPANDVVGIIAEPDTATLDTNGGYKGYRLRFTSNLAHGSNYFNTNDNTFGAGNISTSLKDGYYQLTTIGANVHAGNSVAGTPMASNNVQGVWTLFGSVDPGSFSPTTNNSNDNTSFATIGQPDLDAMLATIGSSREFANPPYNANLDFDLSGDITQVDLDAFLARFGSEWVF